MDSTSGALTCSFLNAPSLIGSSRNALGTCSMNVDKRNYLESGGGIQTIWSKLRLISFEEWENEAN